MPQSGKGVHLWRVRANATFSDHLRLVPRQDPYPNDRQFQAFLGNEVGRGQRMVLMVDPGTRGESLGTERGPGTGWPYPTVPLMFSPSGPVASPLPPPPARYAASASPVGEATRPAWAGPGCLKPWAGAGWIGFPEAIYIYIYIKAAGSPGASHSLRVQHCGAQPATFCILAQRLALHL